MLDQIMVSLVYVEKKRRERSKSYQMTGIRVGMTVGEVPMVAGEVLIAGVVPARGYRVTGEGNFGYDPAGCHESVLQLGFVMDWDLVQLRNL